MIGERDAAQALVLVLALRDVRDKMITRVTFLEKYGSRLEAEALRRDVNAAQEHINQLHRRYLGGEIAAPQSVRQAR